MCFSLPKLWLFDAELGEIEGDFSMLVVKGEVFTRRSCQWRYQDPGTLVSQPEVLESGFGVDFGLPANLSVNSSANFTHDNFWPCLEFSRLSKIHAQNCRHSFPISGLEPKYFHADFGSLFCGPGQSLNPEASREEILLLSPNPFPFE